MGERDGKFDDVSPFSTPFCRALHRVYQLPARTEFGRGAQVLLRHSIPAAGVH